MGQVQAKKEGYSRPQAYVEAPHSPYPVKDANYGNMPDERDLNWLSQYNQRSNPVAVRAFGHVEDREQQERDITEYDSNDQVDMYGFTGGVNYKYNADTIKRMQNKAPKCYCIKS